VKGLASLKIKIGVKTLFVLVLFFIVGTTLLMGCNGGAFEEYEEGYFKYQKNGNSVYISGLTKLGNQQKILVIPKSIGGADLTSIGKRYWSFNMAWSQSDYWESENLEKIFFTNSKILIYKKPFKGCINLKKLIVVEHDVNSVNGGAGVTSSVRREGVFCFISKQLFEVWSYNISADGPIRPANITYYCYYEKEDGSGIYWVDDVDYGDSTEFIPVAPKRGGFVFDGWFREPECVNKWNFEIDKMPPKMLDEYGDTVYQETRLYAKWH
jgi:hypothetical protein